MVPQSGAVKAGRGIMAWYLKIIAKLILSRLPVSYRRWARAGLFRHGKMADSDYARKIFLLHLDVAFPDRKAAQGKVFMEIGPGDSVASALLAAAFGAKATILLDAGNYATRDMTFYRALAKRLAAEGFDVPVIDDAMNFEAMLRACRAEYLTQGLESLKGIPAASVDYIWSHATLEHIRKREFGATMQELHRIMTPDGIMSHNIDLKDHLGGRLNNLRFSEKVWEHDAMANSGFYTNRLRPFEFKEFFLSSGFEIKSYQTGTWSRLPTPRSRLAAPFRALPDAELLVSGISCKLMRDGGKEIIPQTPRSRRAS